MSDEPHYVDGHLEPTVDFDYDAMDRGNPLAADIQGASSYDRLLEIAEKFRHIIAKIYDAKNSKKSALAFMIATGDDSAQGEKITHAAKLFGVSKQDISKCCVDWCKLLGIEPSAYMRSQASKASFRNSNNRKRNHERTSRTRVNQDRSHSECRVPLDSENRNP